MPAGGLTNAPAVAGGKISPVRLREYKPPLIHTRRGATTVLCLTSFIFAISVRALFVYVRHGGRPQFQWPFTSGALPSWALITANAALYAYILWMGVVFYRIARGGERIVVAGWLADILLAPITKTLPTVGASAVRYVQTAAMAAAFLAALVLVRKPYRKPEESDTRALNRRLLVFGFVVGLILLVGALVYFVPRR
jgi:hypothetical protein